MYPLFESIRVEGGSVHLLQYHQKRLERSYLYMFKKKCAWQLNSMIPELPKEGSYKLRFSFNKDRFTFELLPYTSRKIERLKLIEIDSYSYDHKFTDRSGLDNAYKLRGDCDDVLLTKNGFLTDTSYCNILLFDGTKWVTPEKPLFEGVQREFLIDQQRVIPEQIHVNDLSDFISFQLINAMNPFEENRFLAVGGIV